MAAIEIDIVFKSDKRDGVFTGDKMVTTITLTGTSTARKIVGGFFTGDKIVAAIK